MKIKIPFIYELKNKGLEEVKQNLSKDKGKEILPGFSIDCVIFGFHENQLKVLLLRMKGSRKWSLPGGFVNKDEDVDTAADRILEFRTGLKGVFLQQFHLFGKPNRSDTSINQKILENYEITANKDHWLLQRFITLGYYALVEFSKVIPRPDSLSDACEWWDIKKIPELVHDHGEITQSALENIRRQMSYQPIGYNLLPKKFTMPDLQRLYETILNKKLDRRNFQRKILSYDILKKLKERKTGVAHKAPFLYSFNLKKYNQALKDGLAGPW